MKKPLVIYHRLNTRSEFSKLSPSGINGVECDLRMTRDGVVIIQHDRRVQNGNSRYYWVDKLTRSELQEITGDVFEFDEFLELFTTKFSGKKLLLDLDLKQPRMEKEIGRLLAKYHLTNILICSPDIWVLKSFEDVYPNAQIGLTYYPQDKWDLSNNRAFRYFSVLAQFSLKPFLFRLVRRKTKKEDIEIASINHRLVNEKVVSFLHQYDIKLFTWGTENERRLKELVELGVDGIKTKRPDLLRQILRN